MDAVSRAGRTPVTRLCFGFVEALVFLVGLCPVAWPLRVHAQSSICAEVKIQIDQKISLERQAFEAVLKIRNGLDGAAIENVAVNVTFADSAGNPVVASSNPDDAGATFFIRQGLLVGIDSVGGQGSVAPSTSAEAHWLIIPNANAGGSRPEGLSYLVGATVTYRIAGEDRSVDVIPETIAVRPQPRLDLAYFLPGRVYADDALTPEVEPAVPFTLGVRITNGGAGLAANTTIESAQPRITPDGNPQGLLVGFRIEGGYVDDAPVSPSLMLDFGDIAPGQSRMGRWLMTATLSGDFFDFDAAYTHSDALGGALTSLLGPVSTYLLTHDVRVDLPGRDSIGDFLAQPADATQDTDTYRVYESNGTDSEVVQQFDPAFDGTTLSFPALPSGVLVYARRQIDFDGQALAVSAVRSDGKPVAPGNVWFSKRRNASGDGWLHFLNLFEADAFGCGTTCSYRISYDGSPSQASIAGLVYDDANGNGIRDGDEYGIAGVDVGLSGASSGAVSTAADGTFRFAGLPAGTYAVTVGTLAGYYDGAAAAGTAGGVANANTISGIALQAGTRATGYAFAKVPQPSRPVADLAVTALTASTASPRAGEAFTLSVAIANEGPDASGVAAGLALPPSLRVLSSSPSTGSFDPGTGRWTVGTLAPGAAATMTLQVQADSEGDLSVAASVSPDDAAVLDPDAANDTASVAVRVGPATQVRLTASFARETRILAIVSCRQGNLFCLESSRAKSLDAYLGDRGIDHAVVANAADFRKELRSGRWNVFWIDNETAKLDQDSLAEIGLAVWRGASLIVDGMRPEGGNAVDAWAGVSHRGPRESDGDESVEFVANPYLFFDGLVVSGYKESYALAGATLLARYPDAAPAILFRDHGDGRIFTFAYDLVGVLTGNPPYIPLFEQIAGASEPELPAFYTADAYVPVALRIENLGAAVGVRETLAVPAGARIVRAVPEPRQPDAAHATWSATLAESAVFDASAGLRAPAGGVSPIVVDVTDEGSNGLAHQELELSVRATDGQVDVLLGDLSKLQVGTPDDAALRESAQDAVTSAASARSDGRPDLAIARLLDANASLERIASASTASARRALGWLLQAFEREWYSALAACGTSSPILDSGVGFSEFGADQGLTLRHLGRTNYEWRTGFDTNSDKQSTHVSLGLKSGTSYGWTLRYDDRGTSEIDVILPSGLSVATVYSPASSSQWMKSGNALRIQAEALPLAGQGAASIAIHLTSINGTPVDDTLAATSSAAAGTASLHYYGESMESGLLLSGTVTATLPATWSGQGGPPRLSFRVNAGTSVCKHPER